jgi:hypothetical protein
MGTKPGCGEDDGAAGETGGGDMRGVQLAECCKHAVGVCDDGDKAGGASDGAVEPLERRAEAISGEFNWQDVAKCGQCASSAYSAIFLFGSLVLCLAVCLQWILMMKRV